MSAIARTSSSWTWMLREGLLILEGWIDRPCYRARSHSRGNSIARTRTSTNLEQRMNQRIAIYDTTLRDGSQAEGVNFSLEDKVRIARKLDEFGMDYIEGGWPGSNPKDIDFFERMKQTCFIHAKLAA